MNLPKRIRKAKFEPEREKPSALCYVDHDAHPDNPYYIDHMNAHIRTKECDVKKGPTQ